MQEVPHQFRESHRELESQTLGGLELVNGQLDRPLESISYQDVELAARVVADDDPIDGPYLEVHHAALAQELVRQDDELNRLNREIFKRAGGVGDAPEVREWAMFMILVARCVERVGDDTVDIADQVVFVVPGLFRETAETAET